MTKDSILDILDEPVTKRAAGYVKTVNVTERTVRFIASHQRTDADGECVLVKGIDLSRYRANPVLLYQHDLREAGIARVNAKSLKIEMVDGDPALVGEAYFPPEDEDSERAFRKVQMGLLRGFSIGFRSLEQGPPILSGQRGVTHTKTQLLEISLVSLPSCPTCLTRSTCTCPPGKATRSYLEIIDDATVPSPKRTEYVEVTGLLPIRNSEPCPDGEPVLELLDTYDNIDPGEVRRLTSQVMGELISDLVQDAAQERLDYALGRVR